MKKIKLAVIVVTYYPNEDLYDNIMSYLEGVPLFVVWDNTPSEELLDLKLPDSVILQGDGVNKGLAYAYNQGIKMAIQNSCTHIMTMDQDSKFENFDFFCSMLESLPDTTGMYAPLINNRDFIYDETVKNVTHVAQSGCVFSLDMIKEVGGFREDFFIGMVDVEFMLRAQSKGYKIYQFLGCNLQHQIGSERKVKALNQTLMVSDYGPLRHYYDSRNRILMWKEFPGDYSIKGKLMHHLGRIKVCVKILLYEKDKMKKIWAILRGTFNGVFNRIIPY
jgi:rhamnosyltransferase